MNDRFGLSSRVDVHEFSCQTLARGHIQLFLSKTCKAYRAILKIYLQLKPTNARTSIRQELSLFSFFIRRLYKDWNLFQGKRVAYFKILFSVGKWVECLSMDRETGVQFQVESYNRPKKWYLISIWLTTCIIRNVSKVKWRNQGKEVEPSSIPWCKSYWKWSLQVTHN